MKRFEFKRREKGKSNSSEFCRNPNFPVLVHPETGRCFCCAKRTY